MDESWEKYIWFVSLHRGSRSTFCLLFLISGTKKESKRFLVEPSFRSKYQTDFWKNCILVWFLLYLFISNSIAKCPKNKFSILSLYLDLKDDPSHAFFIKFFFTQEKFNAQLWFFCFFFWEQSSQDDLLCMFSIWVSFPTLKKSICFCYKANDPKQFSTTKL